jgi:hypothetical protein
VGQREIFDKNFGYSRGFIGPGRIDSGIEALSVPSSLEVNDRAGGEVRR